MGTVQECVKIMLGKISNSGALEAAAERHAKKIEEK